MPFVRHLPLLRFALGYHNILANAFCDLHGKVPTQDTVAAMQAESDELVPFTSVLADASDSSTYRKVLRVKSLKTYQWLIAEASVYHLLVTCVAINALERCMYKFMKWQEEDQCFVSYTGGQHPPMMQMSNLKNSPGAEAVRHLAHILTSGKIGQYHIHYEELSAGSPFFSFAMFVFIQRNNVMPCY